MNDNTKLEQKNEISDLTSKGITSLRYLLSVLIVFAHNNFTVADPLCQDRCRLMEGHLYEVYNNI